ncbi:hypothetical protein L1887_45772 [Cichorium endivia]|nr:hypothetical protein L1887_45772 [Cichorium endivia]
MKLDAFIQHAVSSVPVSGTSLISSLYGDALSHRGGEIWLGSLAALLEGMGFGERFVRTALFRLNKEGWLDVSRIGRRSFYRLSDKGLRLTRRAENKIYRAELPAWDGKWLLLLSEGLDKTTLADVKKQLIWQGFGTLAPSLMASPSQHLADVQSLLHDAGVAENVIFFEAHSPLALSRAALRSRLVPAAAAAAERGRAGGADAGTLLPDPAAADSLLSSRGAEGPAAAGRVTACALGGTKRPTALH